MLPTFSGVFPPWKKQKLSDELFHLMEPDGTLLLDLIGPFLSHFSSFTFFPGKVAQIFSKMQIYYMTMEVK